MRIAGEDALLHPNFQQGRLPTSISHATASSSYFGRGGRGGRGVCNDMSCPAAIPYEIQIDANQVSWEASRVLVRYPNNSLAFLKELFVSADNA